MSVKILDFRSDTVTRPSDAMREAMSYAAVGDDVYQDDPTVKKLESMAAEILGMEAGLYVTSGTMGNLVALLTHTKRGESVILGLQSHIYHYEVGGIASFCGAMPYGVDDTGGVPSSDAIRAACKTADNVHYAPTGLLCLENTHNRHGGLAVAPAPFAAATEAGRSLGLRVHLDGARLFDACAAWDAQPAEYTKNIDSIMICLSKGLGAPMGSVLCGKADFIETARRHRKAVGGGLRQVGIVAAAGILALENRHRLKEDHENAALLADTLSKQGLGVEISPKPTNMVYFRLDSSINTDIFSQKCTENGLLLGVAGPGRIRMVTHLDVSREDTISAAAILQKVLEEMK